MGDQFTDRSNNKSEWKQKRKMVKMTEVGFENLLTQKWLNGHHGGYDYYEEALKKASQEAFSNKKDDLAKILRDEIPKILDRTHQMLVERAKQHEKDHPSDEPVEFEE